ncbi:MAG: AbrB/MazE/SpoVT family DNA-binding domain-containing protein [Elusimicrobia bacterium]|nr:AbrB/MazE/SpoVT family DNA-binding domain-containing protein [Candidatus Liberimonas magnetica]
MLRKLGQNYQIALPKEIINSLHLHTNDYIDISIKENKIIIEPQLVIPKEQAYFYSADWQKDENEASQDIKKGKTTKTRNLKELFKEIDK